MHERHVTKADFRSTKRLLREALALLGTKRLVFAMHDPSFPATADEDTGLGSPYDNGARELLDYVAGLGFSGLQLGPQGQTSPHNPSPYDGTLFARNTASVSMAALSRRYPWLLDDATRKAFLAPPSARADQLRGHAAAAGIFSGVLQRYRAGLAAGTAEARALAVAAGRFRTRHEDWLQRDVLFELGVRRHRGGNPNAWTDPLDQALFSPADASRERRQELVLQHRERIDDHALVQYLLHEQHADLRAHCADRGLSIYGDLQIGIPPREAWAYRDLLLRDYRMGAPPSRTNPEGQPWGYPLLDPEQCHAKGPALAFAKARADKLFAEYDALRIDHPHGWICPWVYRIDDPDALHAVQNGARLFSSPDRADHPELARYAIVGARQLDRALAPYDEAAVRELEPAQIDRYARLFDVLVAAAGGKDRLICEVLSTQPQPLRAVLARHGLGRFRVTQKANLVDDGDVYRTENARPNDWVMVGTHDTPSIWACVEQWQADGTLVDQADYLARRLAPPNDRARATQLRAWLAEDPHNVAQAKLAELFLCDAENAMVFFADLFGEDARYNAPGSIGQHNWTLRIPRDWKVRYRQEAAAGRALSLPRALALALRARGGEDAERLASVLEALSAAP